MGYTYTKKAFAVSMGNTYYLVPNKSSSLWKQQYPPLPSSPHYMIHSSPVFTLYLFSMTIFGWLRAA